MPENQETQYLIFQIASARNNPARASQPSSRGSEDDLYPH